MGGVDKALIELAGGDTARALHRARLAPQCASLLLSANGDAGRYSAFGIPVVTDASATQEGPMAGLLAALDRIARDDENGFVVSVPVDTPFVPHDLVSRLHAARRESSKSIAVATSGERVHHAVALWPVAMLADMRAAFANGERSLRRFASGRQVAKVEWPLAPIDPFFNVNTPEDLDEAERIIRRDVSGR